MDYLVDASTGRVLADISHPLNDEFEFCAHLTVGTKEAFFCSIESARSFCERQAEMALSLEEAREATTNAYTHSWRYRMLYRLFRVESSRHPRIKQ